MTLFESFRILYPCVLHALGSFRRLQHFIPNLLGIFSRLRVLHPCRFHVLGFCGRVQHFIPKRLGLFSHLQCSTPMQNAINVFLQFNSLHFTPQMQIEKTDKMRTTTL